MNKSKVLLKASLRKGFNLSVYIPKDMLYFRNWKPLKKVFDVVNPTKKCRRLEIGLSIYLVNNCFGVPKYVSNLICKLYASQRRLHNVRISALVVVSGPIPENMIFFIAIQFDPHTTAKKTQLFYPIKITYRQ